MSGALLGVVMPFAAQDPVEQNIDPLAMKEHHPPPAALALHSREVQHSRRTFIVGDHERGQALYRGGEEELVDQEASGL